jgi:hypothetical protein
MEQNKGLLGWSLDSHFAGRAWEVVFYSLLDLVECLLLVAPNGPMQFFAFGKKLEKR